MLLAGLILSQAASIGLQLQDRGQALSQALGRNFAQHIVATVELLEQMPKTRRAAVVKVLNRPPLEVTLALPWRQEIKGNARYSAMLSRFLGRQLGSQRRFQTEVRAPQLPRNAQQRLAKLTPPQRRVEMARYLSGHAFIVQVELRDGAVVSFRQVVAEEIFKQPQRLLLTLLLMLVTVIVLAIIAVRWLTRPLTLLAQAASDLGRDIHRPALAETGPLEVRRAARAFNTMQQRLSRYIQDRSRILAAVSHDLKTPLTRLRLRAELLDDTELQVKIQTDLDDMEHMVQATLEFMRGTESDEAMAPIDINALLESMQDDAEPNAIVIEGKTLKPFQGRPLALKRCLSNIIGNALKYGQRATVQVDDTKDMLRLCIGDEGAGIPEEQLERVFEPFYRLEHSRSRDSGGTGLGLGIARNIARGHGGELSLRNAESGGLEAMLELPR